jgi:hypothetical protein
MTLLNYQTRFQDQKGFFRKLPDKIPHPVLFTFAATLVI